MNKIEKKKQPVLLDVTLGVRLSSAEKLAIEAWAEKEDRKPTAIIRFRDGLRNEGLMK